LTHLRGNKHINPLLQYAFNKYGEEKFRLEIIEEVEKDKLIEREKFYYCKALEEDIMVYNILVPDSSPVNTGRTRFKKGIAPWNKGLKGCIPEVTRLKMSQARKGSIPWNKGAKGGTSWNKGLKMSEEYCQNLSEAHKGQIPWFKKKGVPPPSNTGRTRFKIKLLTK